MFVFSSRERLLSFTSKAQLCLSLLSAISAVQICVLSVSFPSNPSSLPSLHSSCISAPRKSLLSPEASPWPNVQKQDEAKTNFSLTCIPTNVLCYEITHTIHVVHYTVRDKLRVKQRVVNTARHCRFAEKYKYIRKSAEILKCWTCYEAQIIYRR